MDRQVARRFDNAMKIVPDQTVLNVGSEVDDRASV